MGACEWCEPEHKGGPCVLCQRREHAAGVEREAIARVVAWLRAEREAWPQTDDLRDMLAAFKWTADAIERGDWRVP